jgi:AraC family transcriptional regulator
MQPPLSIYPNGQSEAGDATTLIECAVAAFESDHERARRYLTQCLALLRSARSPRSQIPPIVAPPTARPGLAQWQLKRVTAHIDENLASPIQVRELAAMSRLSAGYFSRAFKRTTGVTPYAFIIQKRLARACELMTTTGESLCQITIACGLSDQSHLCRIFRRIVGEAPSTWRRANARGPNAIDL